MQPQYLLQQHKRIIGNLLLLVDVEDSLWLAFPLTQLHVLGMEYWPAWITLFECGRVIVWQYSGSSNDDNDNDCTTTPPTKSDQWRQPHVENVACSNTTTTTTTNKARSRSRRSKSTRCCRDSGLIMSIVLPTTLFSAMSRWDPYWQCHAKLASLLCISSRGATTGGRHGRKDKDLQGESDDHGGGVVVSLALVGMALLLDSQLLQTWKKCWILSILFLVVQRKAERPLREVTTLGEFSVIAWYLTIAAGEWMTLCFGSLLQEETLDTTSVEIESSSSLQLSSSRNRISEYAEFVALSGTVGCAMSSFLIARLFPHLGAQQQQRQGQLKIGSNLQHKNELFFWWRLVAHVIGPLLFVEGSLFYRYGPAYYHTCDNVELCSLLSFNPDKGDNNILLGTDRLPRCLWFLYQFFSFGERGDPTSLVYHYPRYFGLLYWMITLLVLGIPTVSWVLSRKDETADDLARRKKEVDYDNQTDAKTAMPNWTYNHGNNAIQAIQSSSSSSSSSKSSSSSLVVIRRKWFHFVAILLFGPTTWLMPELMSLGYAVATCILVVIECSQLRTKVQVVQKFYQSFLDENKDMNDSATNIDYNGGGGNNRGQGFVLSHIFLIVGCATPLWIAIGCGVRSTSGAELKERSITANTTPEAWVRLLELWGVLCLGVGDAMGACIGRLYGRRPWGKNQRTIEGSVAMWLSMTVVVIVGILVGGGGGLENERTGQLSWTTILVSTAGVTLLEAFTWQMDNLVLPLAGAAVILSLTTTTPTISP